MNEKCTFCDEPAVDYCEDCARPVCEKHIAYVPIKHGGIAGEDDTVVLCPEC